jgi:hypothetical protein
LGIARTRSSAREGCSRMTRGRRCPMAAKPVYPPCTCAHDRSAHDLSKRAGMGCSIPGCACIAYHTTPLRLLHGERLTAELEHWAYQVGRPTGSKQMTVAECHKAHAREQFKQRRTLLVREIEQTTRLVKMARSSWEYEVRKHKRTMRDHARELAKLYATLAALPEVAYETKRKGRAA